MVLQYRGPLSSQKTYPMPNIQFVPYTPKHQQAWYDLNAAWISKHYTIETSDEKVLRDPKGVILDQGGHILILEVDGVPAGTGALIKMSNGKFDYELAKMCVAEHFRGQKLGYKLCLALLELARELGARSVYLESNDRLKPALELYRKLGFQDVIGDPSPYARCNVQMATWL